MMSFVAAWPALCTANAGPPVPGRGAPKELGRCHAVNWYRLSRTEHCLLVITTTSSSKHIYRYYILKKLIFIARALALTFGAPTLLNTVSIACLTE